MRRFGDRSRQRTASIGLQPTLNSRKNCFKYIRIHVTIVSLLNIFDFDNSREMSVYFAYHRIVSVSKYIFKNDYILPVGRGGLEIRAAPIRGEAYTGEQ